MDSSPRQVPPMTRQWSCGVLDSIEPMDVPGTVLLFPQYATKAATFERQQENDRGHEKRTSNGVVLCPQPEETLNDPLNYPLWRRNAALMALGLYCMLGGGMTPMLATGFPNVAETYHVTVPQVALTTGLCMLGLGVGSVFLMPTAIIFGKRPVYLITAVCFIGASIWCAKSPSYYSLLAARITQGIAISPVECLASSTVSELFFLHERAFRLGIYTLLLLSGKNLIPLVSAEIIQALNWRAVFWVVSAVAAFCLTLLALFLPETFWDRSVAPKSTQDVASRVSYPHTTVIRGTAIRDSKENAQMTVREEHADDIAAPRSRTKHHDKVPSPSPPAGSTETYTEYWRHQPPKSFAKSLAIFPGRLSKTPYHLILLRPFVLFAYPSIAWAALTYACSVGWLIVLSESISALYRNRSTYNFTAFSTGLVYLSAFIGGVLGTAVAGKASDYAVKHMAKRNGGVYEPEFRLVMMVPVALCSVAGLMGFGWSIEVRDMYMVPTVFFGLISFGCSLGSTVAISFAVDCYKEFAGEALVTLNFSKNILHGLVWSLFFPEWLEHKGSRNVFVSIGMIQLGCVLFTIPMFMFGKRARVWVARKDMMRRFR